MCYAFTCDVIIKSSFTPRFVHLPLVPSRGKFNPAIGKIYPRATFTPSSCIRGISFFKFTPTITLGFVHTPGWCIRPMALSTVSNAFEKSKKTLITLSPLSRADTIVSIGIIMAVFVPIPPLNPNWYLYTTSCLFINSVSLSYIVLSNIQESNGKTETGL